MTHAIPASQMTPAQLAERRAERKASYRRLRSKVLKYNRDRYRNDPVFRERVKMRAKHYGAANYEHIKRKRAQYREKHRKLLAEKQLFRYYSNRAKYLESNRLRRIEHRERNRANARLHSALLTDSYVRNQLSKYSTQSTHEWTEAEVKAKREKILDNRARRITMETAKEMRTLYACGGFSVEQLADRYRISVSNVFYVLNNKSHYDPDYVWKPNRNYANVSKVMQLLNGSAELAQFYGLNHK